MIPNVSKALIWLETNPKVLKGIKRGLERETLRINADGSLATTDHPLVLGSALTHKWITTDFAETLLEFITPADNDIKRILLLMQDVHCFTARQLGDERMWPFSMPCNIEREQDIKLAQYGTSNVGRLKTLYREGLRNRYGALMQTISGVHYNFSLPMAFWRAKYCNIDKETISAGYLCLIRNYYRFGWIIPYLFGASPAICSSFLQGKTTSLPFEKTEENMCYLPYATSLRLSDLGYANKSQNNLGITFNGLHEYVAGLKRAIKTPSKKYAKIGLEKDGKRLQINSNLLQIENELYAPIRPKRITRSGETQSDALERYGIEYIEVRSLDVNPFSPIGIDEQQIRFLDLFIIWCLLADAPKISSDELRCTCTNWNRVILEGRKPGLTLNTSYHYKTSQLPLAKISKDVFYGLKLVAQTMDSMYESDIYQKVCDDLVLFFDEPELTFSARTLRLMIEKGISDAGCALSAQYRDILLREPLKVISEADFITECKTSLVRQKEIEKANNESFDAFLEKHS